MRKIVLTVAFLLLLAASPVLACDRCEEHFVWPQIDECWFCEEVNCGYEGCTLSGDNDCSMGASGCWNGMGQCDDVWWRNGAILDNPLKPSAPAWRVAAVRVKTAKRQSHRG